MEAVFLKVLNMSVTASYVIVAVLLLRLLLRKMPKKISYLLWSVVAFRLCCPVSWQSVFSLFSLAPRTAASVQVTAGGAAQLDHIPNTVTAAPPQINAGAPQVSEVVTNSLPAAAPISSGDPLQLWITVGTVIWCAGMAALLIYSIVCYANMCRRMRTAVLLRDNIYQSDRIRSPFLLGLVHPKIYIPFGLDEDTLNYVLEHERYHIRRRDYLVKPFAFLLLTVHWFNPLCWLSFHLMGRDMEMSCDEKVIAGGENRVKAYSMSLLSFAVSRHFPAPSPLAFGEASVKSRIKNVLNWKKPKTWATLLAFLLCILAVVACAANPEKQADSEPDSSTVSDGAQTGRYASMEDFANEVLQNAIGREVTYSSYSLAESGAENTTAAARVLDAKAAQLEKTGELAGLASEGTLESWLFQYFVKTDADPDDVALVDGMFEDGWYDPEGAGGHVLVALRYEDGSFDILYDQPVSNAIIGMEFYSYHHSYEEALYDWYVKENGLDLPLYVIDLPPYDELGSHPAHRYDGDGWYLYIPVSGWSKANVWDQWNSQSGTDAHLSVQFCTDRMEDIKAYYGEIGAWPYETDMDSPFDYYYLLNPLGGDAQTELFFVPDTEQSSYVITCAWAKSMLREEELPVLHAMAASFTVDARFTAPESTDSAALLRAALENVGEQDAVTLTRDAAMGPDGADNAALQTFLQGTWNSNNFFNGLLDLTWTSTAAQEEPTARNVTLSAADGWSLRVYEDCDAARFTGPEGEYWLTANNHDVFQHPYHLLRSWYDEAEYQALQGSFDGSVSNIVISDRGQSYQEITQEWVDTYEGLYLDVASGSKFRYTYVKNNVTVVEDMPPFFLEEFDGKTAFGFRYETIFVPENERAWMWSMAGNTAAYARDDPSVPDGANCYWLCGIMYLAEDGWHCNGVGTGW